MGASAIAASEESHKVRERFHSLLMKVNKERPRESDIKALRDLLDGNKELRLWEAVVGMAVAANASRPWSSIWLVTTSVNVRAPVTGLKMKNL